MSIVIPQVGELITLEGEVDYISKVGSFDGKNGPFSNYGVAVGFNNGFVPFNSFAGYATNKQGSTKYKKGQPVELHRHFVINSEGYWTLEVKEGKCPVWLEWVKLKQTK